MISRLLNPGAIHTFGCLGQVHSDECCCRPASAAFTWRATKVPCSATFRWCADCASWRTATCTIVLKSWRQRFSPSAWQPSLRNNEPDLSKHTVGNRLLLVVDSAVIGGVTRIVVNL